jgi:hypothetical protein
MTSRDQYMDIGVFAFKYPTAKNRGDTIKIWNTFKMIE